MISFPELVYNTEEMLIRTKQELSLLVEKNLPKFPLVERYFNKTLKNLLASKKTLKSLLEINMVRYLASSPESVANFEKYLEELPKVNVMRPLSRLKTDFFEYPSVIAELQGAKYLTDEGITEITFLPQGTKNPDICFKENGKLRYEEIKNLMSLTPEFWILNDKFEAESLVNPAFAKNFLVTCKYDLFKFKSVEKLHEELKDAADQLVIELQPKITNNNVEDRVFEIGNFEFKITTKKSERGEFLLLFSGSGGFFGAPENVFLDLSLVYGRFISTFRDGYLQLLEKREGNLTLVKEDRLLIFLNIERLRFIDKEVKKILEDLARVLGMSTMVKLRIET